MVVVCTKTVRVDHSTVVTVTASVGIISYSENWTLPTDNHAYSQEQSQKDFDTHVKKVAREAVGRLVAQEVSEGLK